MLPYFQSDSRELSQLQTSWSAIISPVIDSPLNNGIFLKDIALISGTTIVNHRLGRKPQGWMITDINAAATIYKSQPFNPLTLILTSSAVVTVNLYVF